MAQPIQVFVPKGVRSSMISTERQCTRKFFWVYRLRLKPKSYVLSQALKAGDIYHHIMMPLYRDDCSLEDAEKIAYDSVVAPSIEEFETAAEGDLTGDAQQSATNVQRAWEVARVMARLFWDQYPLDRDRYEVVDTEVPITAPMLGAPAFSLGVQGTPDIIIRDLKENALWLPDHKTTGHKPTDAIVGRGYAWQTYMYSELVHHKYGEWPLGFIYNFVQRPTIRYCPTTKDKGGFESYVERCRFEYVKKGQDVCTSYALQLTQGPSPESFRERVLILATLSLMPVDPTDYNLDTMFPRIYQGFNGCAKCPYRFLCESDVAMWPSLIEQKYRVRED